MPKTRLLLALLFLLSACTAPATLPAPTQTALPAVSTAEPLPTTAPSPTPNPLAVASPDGSILLTFALADGIPTYRLDVDGVPLILPSRLGFKLKDAPPLGEGMILVEAAQSTFDETWEQPWGETRLVRDHHNELRVLLEETGENPRQLVLVFRVFDDGLGFRYELPAQPNLDAFTILDELTEFTFTADHEVWSIPAFQSNRYEYLYTREPLSAVSGSIHTPATLRTVDRPAGQLYLALHEAALVDYASMTLKPSVSLARRLFQLKAKLVPWSDGDAVRTAAPMLTPWRTLQIARRAADLVTSYLVLNLNEPNKLGDVSWVQPGKYIGIWWGMHLELFTWGSGPRHGATTENTKAYLDFAAANGFRGVLVEGWNLGWDGNWAAHGSEFSFTQAYPDFDLQAVTEYAASLGVKLIGHHETGAAVSNYEAQMEDAFKLYQSLGVDTVKTGYVGAKLNGSAWHHGQYAVRHYQKVVETAAQYHISINAHEPIKDTGLRRTYPNFLSREGARGAEYDAWSADGGNPPDHVPTLVFTRLLAGPMDYTPGIFDLRFPEHSTVSQVNTTLAKQLAFYVVIYSPLQMAADLPENYVDQPGFQFIRDVPCDWETTVSLDGEIGEFAVIARQDRASRDWYLGAITGYEARSLAVPLSFLEPGVTYTATLYADGEGAHWDEDPFPLSITTLTLTAADVLPLELAPGGGAAVRFTPIP